MKNLDSKIPTKKVMDKYVSEEATKKFKALAKKAKEY